MTEARAEGGTVARGTAAGGPDAGGADAGGSDAAGRAAAPGVRAPIRRQLVGAIVVYLLLAFALTINTWTDPTNRWVGVCCDQEQSIWFLAWLPHAVATGQNPLLTDRVNAPDGANLMWNAASTLPAAVVAPITLTAGPILAYNVAALLAISLSGLAAFLALRRYTNGLLGPLVAGGLYELSPFVASHAALHLNLLAVFGPPVFLALFDELLVRRTHRPNVLGVAIGLAAAAQLLIYEEILATSALAAAALAIVGVVVVRRRAPVEEALRRLARAAGPALATFLVVGGLPLAVQFLGPQQLHGRVQDPSTFSTDLLNLVLPTPYQLVAPTVATDLSRHFSGLFHEATAYVGLPLLVVLAAVVLAWRRERAVVMAAATAVIWFVLSLGPELHVGGTTTGIPMPWLPFAGLPLLEHVTPGRLTLFMWLAIAALVAIGVDRLAAMAPRQSLPRLAVVAIAIASVVPATAASFGSTVPDFFRSWGDQGIADDETILFAPWFADGAGADPMLWAAYADARPRMVEGYVYVPGTDGRPRYGPDGGQLARYMTTIQDQGVAMTAQGAGRGRALAQLVDSQVSVVIVGPMAHREQMVAFFTDLLGRPPVDVQGVSLWRDVAATAARLAARN